MVLFLLTNSSVLSQMFALKSNHLSAAMEAMATATAIAMVMAMVYMHVKQPAQRKQLY
jgi:hypothetical protein